MNKRYCFLGILLTFLLLGFSFLLASKINKKDDRIKNRPITSNLVEDTIKEQMKEENVKDKLALEEELDDISKLDEAMEEINTYTNQEVDYDLIGMPSDLIYLTVYQMMIDPYTYEGKKIRLGGIYYSGYYEPTDKYYHYCIVEDALACCAQGMEFTLKDSQVGKYPSEDSYVILEGTFETYREDGDNSLYCRLKDSIIVE